MERTGQYNHAGELATRARGQAPTPWTLSSPTFGAMPPLMSHH